MRRCPTLWPIGMTSLSSIRSVIPLWSSTRTVRIRLLSTHHQTRLASPPSPILLTSGRSTLSSSCCSSPYSIFNVDHRFTAIAERHGERPSISVYDWKSNKKRGKTITALDLGSPVVSYMSFSADGKTLVVQGGAPDWSLVLVNWEKAKVSHAARNFVPPGSRVNQVDLCPTDPTLLLVSGDGFLRMFRATAEETLKTVSLSFKRAPQKYTCHAWLQDDMFVVGTDTGELLAFEGTEFKTVLSSSPGNGRPIGAIRSFLKGFLVGCDNATLRHYERSEDPKELYAQRRRFTVRAQSVE